MTRRWFALAVVTLGFMCGLARVTGDASASAGSAAAQPVNERAAGSDPGHVANGAPGLIDFTRSEIRRILQHGPWPPPAPRDPSNRVSGQPDAIALGQRLFFDTRLSGSGTVSCATCHMPERAWTDGRPRAVGLAEGDRNTPTLLDARLQRWFFWDGRADSLWAQAIQPIVDGREMGASQRQVADLVSRDPGLSCLYAAVFGARAQPGTDDERVLVHVAKALAAFVETLGSHRTAFDEFRDALERADTAAAARYPRSAQRGLKTFVGSGNCSLCHFGPTFTNGEFHDVGVPFQLGPGRVDAGRHQGIKRLLADRFNLLGRYSDDVSGGTGMKTRHVEPLHANFGQFKTPSLRNVGLTAPYMHDGRLATLRDVVRHYSELDMERIHTHGEQLLRPLKLAPSAIDDLIAFLETLSDRRATAALPPPSSAIACPR
jgi:cytochrome c peroxidase